MRLKVRLLTRANSGGSSTELPDAQFWTSNHMYAGSRMGIVGNVDTSGFDKEKVYGILFGCIALLSNKHTGSTCLMKHHNFTPLKDLLWRRCLYIFL